jgi:hypothetical protein
VPRLGQDPFLTEQLYVTALDTKPVREHRFNLAPDYNKTPGTRVGDESLPEASQSRHGQITYVIPEDASDLDDVIDEAIRQSRSERGTSFLSRSSVVLVAVISLAILLVIVILWRRT